MRKYDEYDNMKKRLIIAGIAEIEEHGLSQCSLRRVATKCDVSCAAPYKHFKNKNDFILSIIRYIAQQWKMLEKTIVSAYSSDKEKQITEVAAAYIRFWIANPNFRSILLMNPRQMDDEQKKARADIDKNLTSMIYEYKKSEKDAKKTVFEVRSLIYGALIMLEYDELENSEQTIEQIKISIKETLK